MKQMILDAAKANGLELSEAAAEKLCIYHEMLTEANKVMNLTRVSDDPAEAIDRNYIDSILPMHLLKGAKTLCDVGSGAGFPGIPLSIVCPDVHVVLMDSLGKRVNFLNSVIEKLGLNAEAVHIRAEDGAKDPKYRDAFDVVTARAVAAMPVLCELALPFVKVGGRMLAYKGPSLPEELETSGAILKRLHASVTETLPVRIAGRDWEHNVCIIKKEAPTPKSFPRKAGEANRNPILN